MAGPVLSPGFVGISHNNRKKNFIKNRYSRKFEILNIEVHKYRDCCTACDTILTAKCAGLRNGDSLYLLQNISYLTVKFASSHKVLTIFSNLPADFLQLSRCCRVHIYISVCSPFTNVTRQPLQNAAVFQRRPFAVYYISKHL